MFYRAISDEINRALFIDRTDINSGKVIMIRDNFDDTSAYGFELSTNYRPTKWWSINGSFDIFSQTQKGIAERLTAPIETATVSNITTDIKEVDNVTWNYSYFPVIFNSEETLLKVQKGLNDNNIFPRRYFYPSLNTIEYAKGNKMPVSESIAQRVLCLPLYVGLTHKELNIIVKLINVNI